MCASDDGGVLEFVGAAVEYIPETRQLLQNNLRGLFDLQRLGSIHNIIGSKAVMQPACVGTNFFRNRGGEGYYVMLHLGLHFLDAFQIEVAAFGNGLGGSLRHNPSLGQGETGGNLHLQPAPVFISIAPDAAHFRAGITRNHRILRISRNRDDKCWQASHATNVPVAGEEMEPDNG